MSFPSRLVLSLLILSSACKTVDEHKDEPIVKSLRIEGAKQLSGSDIEGRILTEQNSWIPFSSDKHFDPNIWRADLKRIERFYRQQGYYQADVVSDEIKPLDAQHVAITVTVDEGRPTRVSAIHVKGLETLPQKDQTAAREDLPLRVGDVFAEAPWEGTKKRLEQTLRERGYAAATVTGVAKVDVATQRAEIDIEVIPGARYHFGDVHVIEKLHARTEPWRIIEQAQRDIAPDVWYSESAQAEAQSRIFKMGVFGAVRSKPETPDPQTGRVPIAIDVQESRFHSMRYGVGVGVDPTRYEGRLIGEYIDRDFMGGLRKLTFKGTAGWAFIPGVNGLGSGGQKSGPIAKVSAELEQPRFFHPELKVQTRLELERGLEPAYSFLGGRAKMGLIWQPTPHLAISPSYNVEAYRLDEGVAGLGGNAPPLLFGCQGVCVLSYLEERIEWDKRDNPQEPKNGYFLGLTLQEGGGVLGGSFSYLKVQPEGRIYYSVGREQRLTFAGRVKVGTLRPFAGTLSPIVARFFSGGNEMRGFNSQRLSPLYVVPYPPGTMTDVYTGIPLPIGGNGLFESSVEARYQLWGPLVWAVFIDTGFVTAESFQVDASYIGRNMLYAVGTGVRYRTPIGPLRLDFAFRPDNGPPLPVTNPSGLTYPSLLGCFGIGGKSGSRAGSPEGPCTLQLSIGEAF